jgi:hypothetical protein
MNSGTDPHGLSDGPWLTSRPGLPTVAWVVHAPGDGIEMLGSSGEEQFGPVRRPLTEWVESLRISVEGTPLDSVAAAFGLGPLVALLPG